MSDPRRLLEGADDDLAATLLRAARDDAPADGSKKRAAAALGLTGTAGIGAASGGTAGTAAKVVSASLVTKWIGAGVAGVVMVSAASTYRAPQVQTPGTRAATVATAMATAMATAIAPPSAPVAASVTAPEPVAEASATPVVKSVPALPSAAHALGREVALLDEARTALAAGDPGEALHRLDAYAHAFPDGALALEASVVRVEALHARGDDARASNLARQILVRHPDAPQAAHLRTLLRELQSANDPPNP